MTWTPLRTLTTQAAEGRTAPDPSTYKPLSDEGEFTTDMGRTPYVEIRFDPLTLAGAPASVTFGVWRTSDTKIDRVAALTVASGDAGSPTPVEVDFHGESISVTVESFSGGTSPTVSGAVYARPVRP